MQECNAMQLLETKEKNTKTKKQRTMVTKEKVMKHKDQENKIDQGHRITPIT